MKERLYMKLRQWILLVSCILITWFLASAWIDNSIILPSPYEVIEQMITQIKDIKLYESLVMTFFRVFLSVFVSSIVAFIVSFLSHSYKSFATYFDPILLFLRSIPNVTFVILLLFWVSREMSIYIVSFLLLFPIFYQNLYESIQEISKSWKDIFIIYPQSWFKKLKMVYLPLLRPAIVSSWISCSSLGFKVVVMAEIMTSVSLGIGANMQYDRLNLNLAGVMAWTIWLLICVCIFNTLLKKVLERLFG